MAPVASLQLYTVNTALVEDMDGTLAKLAAMGLTNVEAFAFVDRADALAEAFSRHGLVARTGHAPLVSDELKLGEHVMHVPPLDDVFAAAKVLGLEYVIDPFVPIDRWTTAEAITATAQRLNQVAEQAASHGLKVGYHNHSQEFVADIDGVCGYEFFANQLADGVALEVDLFWAATAVDDVPGLLTRLGAQVKALHIKDGVIISNPFTADAGSFDPSTLDQRPAGQGEVPLAACLAAAPTAEYAVIEYDHAPGDVFDAVQGSVEWLNAQGIR